jgi:methyltransferase (TIGR00027 family)
MKEGEPSGSAIIAAMNRAAHLAMDNEPKILKDDLALSFSGIPDYSSLISALEAAKTQIGQGSTPEFAHDFFQSYRGFAVVRHRYTEDELEKALERGITQYVILGAGLDSFAYRRQDLENKLKVYEVDHPATQTWKKNRLQELNISLPENLTFVPVDFEKRNLTEELFTAGYQSDRPAFFSWLGVTQYLTESAVFQTLREVAAISPRNEIVFEYVLPESLLNGGDRQMVANGKRNPHEPWLSMFDPTELVKKLKEMGYTDLRDFGQKEANELYFSGRADELSSTALDRLSVHLLNSAHLMKARV